MNCYNSFHCKKTSFVLFADLGKGFETFLEIFVCGNIVTHVACEEVCISGHVKVTCTCKTEENCLGFTIFPAFAGVFGVKAEFAQFFGGTSLLILVGVVLDTLQQVESHLLMRHYDGLLNSGRIKGRSGNVAAY